MKLTTCQICGRPIKLVNGLIAHHGYRQPWLKNGDGSRTTSCDGSRQLPYEVSRSAIPLMITIYEGYVARAEADRDKIIANPPDTLTYTKRDAWGNVRQSVAFPRPADFDPKSERYCSQAATYGYQFNLHIRGLNATARGYREAAAFLTTRYEAWVGSSRRRRTPRDERH